MLARGVLGRLAAATDAPKTSTHDLARISRVLARAVIARNASSFALTGSVSHAYKLAYAIARRSYATATTKKAPAKTVEKVTVKKTVTKKPAAKKSATKKQPAAKKKAAPKKPKAKKVAPKKKPVKRVPTEKTLATREKRKQLDAYKALKEAALTSPKKIVDNAWTVFLNEKGTKGGVAFAASQASTEFKALSPSEREVSLAAYRVLTSFY
jgi:outer membrane biosynthesis protein TonB